MCLRESLFNLISAVDVHFVYFVVRILASSTLSSVFASEEANFSIFLNDKLMLLMSSLCFAADNALGQCQLCPVEIDCFEVAINKQMQRSK